MRNMMSIDNRTRPALGMKIGIYALGGWDIVSLRSLDIHEIMSSIEKSVCGPYLVWWHVS